MSACRREQNKNHDASPGAISDEERLCRGVFDPMHYDSRRKLRRSFFKPADLRAGSLSVWRCSRTTEFGIDNVREQLLPKVPANQTLEKILFVTAGEVRRLRIRSETLRDRQIFCVLDDCTTDKEGNSHPEHAVIGLCIAHAWKEESDELQMAVEGLKVLFNAAAATQ